MLLEKQTERGMGPGDRLDPDFIYIYIYIYMHICVSKCLNLNCVAIVSQN